MSDNIGSRYIFPPVFGQIPPTMRGLGGRIPPPALELADLAKTNPSARDRTLPPNPSLGGGVSQIRIGNKQLSLFDR